MNLEDLGFHPATARWFSSTFAGPTPPQEKAWRAIRAREDVLVSAPTGSGKTLAAFLVCLDRLLARFDAGEVPGTTTVVYVSPLKALGNDIHRNLEVPLRELWAIAREARPGLESPRIAVRSGDTPARERQSMVRKPPHILVTTPESLYLLLTGSKSRETLRNVETVIVDEVHALARDRRGTHLTLSLERLEKLSVKPPQRVGLSATVKPIEEVARFLVGTRRVDENGRARCRIVDEGHLRALDLGVELPATELSTVCSNETWEEIYAKIAQLVESHRSTLIFVNTRRLAERVGHHLTELLGEGRVASHHGSLSKDIRLKAEEDLKSGKLKALVATASMELGIDVGYIDLVLQIASPRAIATFLQRVGRSGHFLGGLPCGRLFPLTREDLIESLALIRAIRARRLDRIVIPTGSRDILAQQIVASVATEEWSESELYDLCRQAWPYRDLPHDEFEKVLDMLEKGVGPRGAHLHRDRINGRVRPRRGARLAAITSGGAIPENADYRVVLAPDRGFVGTVNEDFAIESMAGDIFLLGNTSWRILNVRAGEVLVDDAHGAPATIPFWLGEAPSRTRELSEEVGQLREDIASRLSQPPPGAEEESIRGVDEAIEWLRAETTTSAEAAGQVVRYVAAQKVAVGMVPTGKRLLFERFFDESGGMQLVVHAPLGGRINRAWGLAMRKRFCRSFDFELQASAVDNGFVLSMGPGHSFPLEDMVKLVPSRVAKDTLVQALLAAPMFQTRWRWNVTRALAVLRFRKGRKVPPPLQRFQSDDLLTAVFPAQTACQENRPGDIEVPDHPLVRQTVEDCLSEAMDLEGWLGVLTALESGALETHIVDTREPSPFSYEILNAQPYAFLDDAPLEERRARAVAMRRSLPLDALKDLARLDPDAITQVKEEAWPAVRDPDELHDVLSQLVLLPERSGEAWAPHFEVLVDAGRAMAVERDGAPTTWAAAESRPGVDALFPRARLVPRPTLPPALEVVREATEVTLATVRGWLQVAGPVMIDAIAASHGLEAARVRDALLRLELEGAVIRGHFTRPGPGTQGTRDETVVEWCDRGLLARIHRRTLDRLRKKVKPVEPATYWRFLLEHHGLGGGAPRHGAAGVIESLEQLEGLELPAGAWESEILAVRNPGYQPAWLDDLTLRGMVAWGRLRPPAARDEGPGTGKLNRVVPLSLVIREDLPWLLPPGREDSTGLARSPASRLLDLLRTHGALFLNDLRALSKLLPAQVDEALAELAGLGLVTADSFAAIRAIVAPPRSGGRRDPVLRAAPRPARGRTVHGSGRWSLFPGALAGSAPPADRLEAWAHLLLARYGVVFRDLLRRETVAPPWRELIGVYRRMEARGEVHGGRFVAGPGGEQFTTADSVERLRENPEHRVTLGPLVLSAADPLNLVGILDGGQRLPATRVNRIYFDDGVPIAVLHGGEVRLLVEGPRADLPEIERRLRASPTSHDRPERDESGRPRAVSVSDLRMPWRR